VTVFDRISATPDLRSDRSLIRTLAQARITRLRRNTSLTAGTNRGDGLIKGLVLIPTAVLLFLAATVVTAVSFGQADTVDSANALLRAMVLVSFATVIAGCLTTSLQSLFLSEDVQFLVSLPIPVRLIFFAKFMDYAMGAIPGALFLLAVCLGYVLGRADSFAFVILAIPVVLTLTVTAIFISALITATVIRLAPARQTRLMLILTSLTILVGTSLTWQRVGNLDPTFEGSPGQPDTWSRVMLLPPGWATSILAGMAGDDRSLALPYLGLLLGTMILIGAGAARLFSITYTRNMERTDLARSSSLPRRPPRAARLLLRLAPRALLHWVKREWILVGRDFSRLSAALWPIAGAGLYAVIALWQGIASGNHDGEFWLSHGPLLLVPWGISTGTAVFAIGAEGNALGLIRSLPVKPGMLVLGKFFAYLIPIASISLSIGVAAIAFSPGSTRDNYLFLVLVCILSAVFCGVDIGVSAMAPRFGAEHVQRSTAFAGRAISLIAGLAAAFAVALGLGMSPFGRESIGNLFFKSDAGSQTIVWLSLLAAGILLPLASMRIGTGRIGKLLAED